MTGRRIIVWGAGGHGQVVADVAEACGWEVAAFVARESAGPTPRAGRSLPVLSDAAARAALAGGAPLPLEAVGVALGVGDNDLRLSIASLVGYDRLPVLVHPSAILSPSARLGPGTVVMPNVVVNARAIVGAAVILNTSSVVEHDCRVGDGAHLSPGALLGGEVIVERLAWICTGGVVIPRRTVGEGAILGAGSTAHKDLRGGATYVGNPARVIPGRGAS